MPKLRLAALLVIAAIGVSACNNDSESNPGVDENKVQGSTVETNPTTLGSEGRTEPTVTQEGEGSVTTETP
jgi:hypothetical protein